ncbi:MAG: hypothetical protein ABWY29_10960 [Blastococcus sp.]
MKKRFTTLLATVGLTLAGVAVAPAAQADAPCTISNFSPRSVVVGLTPIVKTFKVSTTGCSLQGWIARTSDYTFLAFDDAPQETFSPWLNSEAGPKDAMISAYSVTTTREKVFPDGFSLLRRTTWQSGSFNASPEPVKKGAPLSITGRLLVVDWTNDKYIPYAGRSISVQFRTPTGAYSTVKKATTDKNGWVRTTVPASATGVWRLSYGGNTIAGSSLTVGDAVTVTR